VQLKRNDQPVTRYDERRATALELIEVTLNQMEAAALLEPQAG
jgi:hypothetical protein